MMKWSHTLIAGSAVILLTNAVALGGVAWNRSGEAESSLQLTQRELNRSHSYSGKDNSGIALSLNWRFEQARLDEYNFGMYSGNWGMPLWLDSGKLAQLGFDVEKLAGAEEYGRRRNVLFEPKEALLVLELDGPSRQRHLQRTREFIRETARLLAASPASAEMQRKARHAEENYRHELDKGSRLFAIDAGIDLASLRAAYPDRNRYAIVHALIRPSSSGGGNGKAIGGYISELHAARINVPLRYRPVFEGGAAFAATVAFGRRLEPWLEAAAKADPVKEGNQ